MSEFIDALISTPVVRFAFKWLRAHGSDRRCAKLRTITDFGNLLYYLAHIHALRRCASTAQQRPTCNV